MKRQKTWANEELEIIEEYVVGTVPYPIYIRIKKPNGDLIGEVPISSDEAKEISDFLLGLISCPTCGKPRN